MKSQRCKFAHLKRRGLALRPFANLRKIPGGNPLQTDDKLLRQDSGQLGRRLVGHLALELGDGQQHVEGQAAHRGGRIELLCYLAHSETLKHRPCRSHAVNVTMPGSS